MCCRRGARGLQVGTGCEREACFPGKFQQTRRAQIHCQSRWLKSTNITLHVKDTQHTVVNLRPFSVIWLDLKKCYQTPGKREHNLLYVSIYSLNISTNVIHSKRYPLGTRTLIHSKHSPKPNLNVIHCVRGGCTTHCSTMASRPSPKYCLGCGPAYRMVYISFTLEVSYHYRRYLILAVIGPHCGIISDRIRKSGIGIISVGYRPKLWYRYQGFPKVVSPTDWIEKYSTGALLIYITTELLILIYWYSAVR